MINELEIWKDVINYEGLYKVSNLGNIKSFYRSSEGIILKLIFNNKGYYTIRLSKNGVKSTRQVHQLVAESFLNHIPNKYEKVINHINGIKIDNRLENLEIVTNRYNTSDGFKRLNKTSNYPGVCWNKDCNKWQCDIQVDDKSYYLGLFDNELSAKELYELALEKIEINQFNDFSNEIIEKRRLNKQNNKTSNYKGVSFNKKSNKWMARSDIKGKRYYFGSFINEKDAYNAYLEAINKISLGLL